MAIDIIAIDQTRGINNINAVCSTTFTGQSATRSAAQNYPGDLTIQNIETKFDNRFYNGIFVIVLDNNHV